MDRLPPAKKRFGQNFLVSSGAIAKISRKVAEIGGNEVLEIGPGRGALTEALLQAGLRVTAVEIDRHLAAYLVDRFRESHFTVRNEDILEVTFQDLFDIGTARFSVAGNLPYNISKPVVQKLIAEREGIDGAVLMFQKEVAARLTAAPGTRDYGPLGIFAGAWFRIRPWFDLAPGSFRPAPKVTSTVTVWERNRDQSREPESESRLRDCLTGCFRYRRQTLYNNLRRSLTGGSAAARQLLDTVGLDGKVRAETLEPASFLSISRHWPEPSG